MSQQYGIEIVDFSDTTDCCDDCGASDSVCCYIHYGSYYRAQLFSKEDGCPYDTYAYVEDFCSGSFCEDLIGFDWFIPFVVIVSVGGFCFLVCAFVLCCEKETKDVDVGAVRIPVGTKVKAQWHGGSTFYNGRIARDHGNGTYDIAYDDGDKESMVKGNLITICDSGSSTSGGATHGNKTPQSDIEMSERRKHTTEHAFNTTKDIIVTAVNSGATTDIPVGTKVKAQWHGGSTFYNGRIARDHGNGTYDIAYDDGDKESKVKGNLISICDSGSSTSEKRKQQKNKDEDRCKDTAEHAVDAGKDIHTAVNSGATADITDAAASAAAATARAFGMKQKDVEKAKKGYAAGKFMADLF